LRQHVKNPYPQLSAAYQVVRVVGILDGNLGMPGELIWLYDPIRRCLLLYKRASPRRNMGAASDLASDRGLFMCAHMAPRYHKHGIHAANMPPFDIVTWSSYSRKAWCGFGARARTKSGEGCLRLSNFLSVYGVGKDKVPCSRKPWYAEKPPRWYVP
jgi:hypothetical protein